MNLIYLEDQNCTLSKEQRDNLRQLCDKVMGVIACAEALTGPLDLSLPEIQKQLNDTQHGLSQAYGETAIDIYNTLIMFHLGRLAAYYDQPLALARLARTNVLMTDGLIHTQKTDADTIHKFLEIEQEAKQLTAKLTKAASALELAA